VKTPAEGSGDGNILVTWTRVLKQIMRMIEAQDGLRQRRQQRRCAEERPPGAREELNNTTVFTVETLRTAVAESKILDLDQVFLEKCA
jgi:hypothetical protein